VSLSHIDIPSTVKEIHPSAFFFLYRLVAVTFTFCDEIEQFVSGVSLGAWWNNGSTNMFSTLKTYNFLARFNIPARVGRLDVRNWQTTIYDMLQDIHPVGVDAVGDYFDPIDSKLKSTPVPSSSSCIVWWQSLSLSVMK
jgi:hypothetical protein